MPRLAALLLLLTSCCLEVADGRGAGGTGTIGTSGGSGATTGSVTRPDSGPSPCTGFFCAPNFVCDTTDGFCKCDGQLCASGNCTADGTCLPGCPADGGAGTLMLTVGPVSNGIPPPGSSKAIVLPTASLGKTYALSFQAFCGMPPYAYAVVTPLPPGLALYQEQGQMEGVPTASGLFEFEIQVSDSAGATAAQNFILYVVGA